LCLESFFYFRSEIRKVLSRATTELTAAVKMQKSELVCKKIQSKANRHLLLPNDEFMRRSFSLGQFKGVREIGHEMLLHVSRKTFVTKRTVKRPI
jgi:hypothetical protein